MTKPYKISPHPNVNGKTAFSPLSFPVKKKGIIQTKGIEGYSDQDTSPVLRLFPLHIFFRDAVG